MDSNPKTKKQRHMANRNYQADNVLLPSSPKHSSISNPIDISGDESQTTKTMSKEAPRSAYQGTARQPPPSVNGASSNTSKMLVGRADLTQSPHFNKPGLPAHRANGNAKKELITENATRETSPGLARRFVAADGSRRGSDVNASSDADELQSAPMTVGQNADPDAVFTVKELRSNSPSKHSSSTLKSATPTDPLPAMAPSIIKSDFPDTNARGRNSGRPIGRAPREQEAKPAWSVALAAVSLPGELVKDDDLGLVYDEKEDYYYVQRRGDPIRTEYSTLRIQPPKLIKIVWERSGLKVRLESSRSGTEDNVLDLEFARESDASDLLRRLQKPNSLQVIGKNRYVVRVLERAASRHAPNLTASNSEQMQKIFERRRSELGATDGATNRHRPGKTKIFSYSRQRNDSSKHLAPSDRDQAKRRLQKSSIVDELVHGATHGTDMAAARPETRMPAMPHGLPEDTGIKSILAKVRPAHNEHLNLRRSTRNSGAYEGESLLSSLDGIPEKEKYSVKHGLGDPWKRSLTYPKAGKKKTTVEWSDLERLDEGEFLNDNLISFYLRYLEQRLEEERPELAKRVYFFNTFFFATLTNTHKDRKRFNYEGVQKWTRSVDLFTYDYIIVPINEQAHWYVAIICNMPALGRELAMPEDEATSPTEDSGPVPKQEPVQTEERATSPKIRPDGNESEMLTPNAKEPNERETRNSFSQMSLEHNARLPVGDGPGLYDTDGPGKARPASEDKEMLDSHIEDTMPGFAATKEAEHHPAPSKEQGEGEDLIEDQDESPKGAAKSRKGKRKSLPAPITKVDPRKPAIITFDSLGQARGQTIRILKDYLREEAKAKRGMEFEESQIKGINAKRIPQQDNFSDCGVFLLGYVDTFLGLGTDPKEFITKTIQQTHSEKDWSKLVPGDLRASIRNQVQELHEIQTNERREESAKKSGMIAQKENKKLESSPSRAPDQTKTIRKEPGQAGGADTTLATTSKAPNPSSLGISRTRNEALETASGCEEEDFSKENDVLEQLFKASQQGMQKSAEYQRMYNPDDDELGQYDGGAPAGQRDEPSVIMVDSQSQQRSSAPTGVTYPSFSPGKQSYPESTSSKMVNPILLSFEKEKSLELPSEIPDSQNSNTSRKFAAMLDKPALIAPAANSGPAPPASEVPTVISDVTRGLPDLQGERGERSKRKKTGRDDRAHVHEAPEKEDMIFTMDEPSGQREERKDPPKRRKKSTRQTSKDVEEVQYHIIDD